MSITDNTPYQRLYRAGLGFTFAREAVLEAYDRGRPLQPYLIAKGAGLRVPDVSVALIELKEKGLIRSHIHQ